MTNARIKFAALLFAVAALFALGSRASATMADAWWDPDGAGAGQDWQYRLPVTFDKPSQFATATYANHFASMTIDFSAAGFDAIASTSVRLVRYTGSIWATMPIDLRQWLDKDADGGKDVAQIWFSIDSQDLTTSQTSVSYYVYFDLAAGQAKTAATFPTIASLNVLCYEGLSGAATCSEMSKPAYATIDKVSVTVASTTVPSTLTAANLANYDQLYLGYYAVSSATGSYTLTGYETDIKNFAYNGGSVLAAANNSSGWSNAWLPDPGQITENLTNSPAEAGIAPYTTEIFNFPNPTLLPNNTRSANYFTSANGVGWIPMATVNGAPAQPLYLRKNWGVGNFILSSVDTSTTNRASGNAGYLQNSIYWAWRYQTQNLAIANSGAEWYKPSSINIYSSSAYTTLISSPKVGDTMYIEMVGVDTNNTVAGTQTVSITSTGDATGITLTLTESTVSSGQYRGTALISTTSGASPARILSDAGQTITVTSNNTKVQSATTTTVIAVDATAITSIDLKSDATYATTLTDTVSLGSGLYIEITGTDGNSLSTDITTINVISTTDPAGVTVNLTETGRNTGVYRGTATVSGSSNDALDYIGAVNNDTITTTSNKNPAHTDTCLVKSTPPTSVTSLTIYQSDYSTHITTAAGDATIYVEVVGTDGNAYGLDTTSVTVKSSITDTTGISVPVFETGANTGRYRGSATLKSASNQASSYIGAQSVGETVTVISNDAATQTDTITVTNSAPSTIASVILKTDATYATTLTSNLVGGSVLYIELAAADLNAQTRDTTSVTITSSETDPTGFTITLTESAVSSGLFRGTATIKSATNAGAGEIGADTGETITLTSVADPSKTDAVDVLGSSPSTITSVTLMNSAYTAPLATTVAIGDGLYIEVIAPDVNPNTMDTTTVTVTSTSDTVGITVTLTESAPNSGKFREVAVVSELSDPTTNEIQSANADTITIKSDVNPAKSDTVTVSGTPPKGVFSVKLYQSNYTTLLTQLKGGDVIYIEAMGIDASTTSTDKTTVNVFSTTDNTGIVVSLTELASGTQYNRPYRGTATVRNVSDQALGYIQAAVGDTIKVSSDKFMYMPNGSNEIWFEGETPGSLTPKMTSGNDAANTSGGKYTHTPQGQRTGTAEYPFYLSAGGTFRLFGRMLGIDANGNDFSARMDAGTNSTWTAATGTATYNKWIDPWKAGPVASYTLAAGAHVFRIRATGTANDGARLDKAVFKTINSAPGGFGGAPIQSYASATLPVVNTQPTAVSAVTLKSDGTYAANLAENLELNDTLYIQLQGTDGDIYMVSTTTATVKSGVTDTTGITVTLTETGINTGIFRNTAFVKTASNQANRDIGAATNETVTVTSTVDGTKQATATVDTAAALSINTVTAIPAQVNRGQTGLTVTFNVANTGSAPADVTAANLTFTNNGDFTVTPSGGNPTQIAGNATNSVFTFTVDVAAGAALATNTIDATITAADRWTAANASDNGAATADSWRVMQAGALTSSISATPTTVSGGQTITVTMTVDNGGGNTVNNAAPSNPVLGGTSSAVKTSGPTPASANIAAGGQQLYTWTYTASTSAGTVNFNANAAGVDSVSGAPVSSTNSSTNDITIQTAAALSASITSAPSNVAQSQSFTVTMRVTNTGQAAANAVAPSALTLGGSSTATKTSGPTPASSSIPGGSYIDFVWTYQAASTNGTVNFTGGASGSDANSAQAVNASPVTSNDTTIQAGAALSASTTIPAQMSTGQNFTVTMIVTNTGQGSASNVAPATLVKNGTSNATYVSGPTPSSANIPGGATQAFTWSYTVSNTAGSLNLGAKVYGNDALTGLPINSATSTSNTALVQLKASLSANPVTITPGTISTGQDFTVTMRVKNNGTAVATSCFPMPLTIGGAATATYKTGPTPATFYLPGGTFRDVTWTYTAGAGAGTINFTGYATATDINTGLVIAASPVTSSDASIVQAGGLTSTVSIASSTINTAQNFTVTMVVTNTGAATVNNTAPSALAIGGAATAVKVSGPSPASVNLAGGATQAFTWTYTAGGASGTINFSGKAAGTDVNSGGAVSSATSTSPNSTVQTPAALNMSISASPSTVGTGDSVTLTMTVTNTGGATANSAAPSALTIAGGGNAIKTSGPTPASATIAGGAQQQFTWVYAATTYGTANFTGTASAVDNNTGGAISSTQQTSNNVSISANPDAVLVSTISASPSTVSAGQTITVTMLALNTGDSGANNVVPSALTKSGTGNATLSTGPSPASANIAAGQSATFTWTYTTSATGTINFSGNATGDNLGVPPPVTVSSTVTSSNDVTIQSVAALSSSISIPATRNKNQTFTVTMTVNNTGGAAANAAAPSALTLGGTSSASIVSGPTPANATIASGGQQQFTWTYTAANTSGTLTFTGNAAGTDSNSGGAVSSTSNTSNTMTVQSPAALAATIAASQYTVSNGQSFTITMTVNNTGQESASAVAPSALTLTGPGSASKVSGPTPSSAAIAGGGQQQFTWTYTANATGSLTLAGYAAGTGANSGSQTVSATATTPTVTVVVAAGLSNIVTSAPGQVSVGQNVTVTMTLTNNGQASANTAAPSALTLGGTAAATKTAGPTPSNATIAGGANQQFTWTYNTTSPGTLNFTGNAAGTDANSGSTVTSNTDVSDDIQVVAPAGLSAALTAAPATVSYGQQITITMTVTNTGAANANTVTPSAISFTGGTAANVIYVDGPTPANRTINGGATGSFTWHYTAASSTVTMGFRGSATGTDANSGSAIASAAGTSNNIAIQSPPSLSAAITTSPFNTQPTGAITVTMTITNSGGATANNIAPSTLTLNGTSTANYVSGPSPATGTAAAGAQQVFTWSYTAGLATGTVRFTGSAAGKDANTNGAVSSSATSSDYLNITTLAPRWIYPSSGVIGAIRSSASTRNNTVYIGSDDHFLYALDSASGTFKWKRDTAGSVVSTPFPLDDGNGVYTIYVGSNSNYVFALTEANAAVPGWPDVKVNVGNSIVSTTITDGTNIYFGAYDNKVHAVSVANGATTWISPTLNGTLVSSPAIGTGEIYIGSTDGKIYALNLTDGTYLRSFQTGGPVEGSPWEDMDGMLYIGSDSGKFFKLNASNFTQQWVYPTSGNIGMIKSSPWVEHDKGSVYFGSNDGKIYALSLATGTMLTGYTPYTTGGAVRSSPLVWKNIVYCGSDDGKVYAINALTGALLAGWPYNTGGVVYSSPSLDFIDGLRDRIVIGSSIGKIFSFNAY